MINLKSNWLIAALACLGLMFLALWPVQTLAQQATWEQHMRAGIAAYRQGDYAEAETQLNAGLGVAEAFGTRDPRVATSLNNLGRLYQDQGRHSEAELLYKRSLGIREKTLGPAHPDVATSLNNLALLYHTQGRYGDAEPLYKRSLGIQEKALGPAHPRVAISLKNYADLLRKTGRDEKAKELEARAKEIRDKHTTKNPAKCGDLVVCLWLLADIQPPSDLCLLYPRKRTFLKGANNVCF